MLAFIMILGATISAVIASAKNRNIVAWMFAGAFFPAISVIIVACQPALPRPGTEGQLPGARVA